MQCPACQHQFDPQDGPASGQTVRAKSGARYKIKELLPQGSPPNHRLYAMLALRPDGEKIYLPIRDEDSALYDEAVRRLENENIPLPGLDVRSGHNTDQARNYNYLHWRDFFNKRQLLCLGLLLKKILEIENISIQEQMICLFSSTLEFNNLFCSYKGEGTGAVRHMFSNHIIKPERVPLENSVWGSRKSSGTFRSLFESRLVRAKRYLGEPFEITLETDLLGERAGASRIVASAPIAVPRVSSWCELEEGASGALILNGNSAALPIPAGSIDAVVTDPPYFDFVHYSELSDFFFAWLSPVLRHRYAWFNKADSSNTGEVQHKDPRTFARQLGLVFSESCRVLKDEGVLAFSFHHSRAEGWAAIYEAISSAGLSVVAAHPVHAEMRAASPKSAAKDPISLDAILVCRKRGQAHMQPLSDQAIVAKTDSLVRRLRAGGLHISAADQFVIGASQVLIAASHEELSFAEMERRLEAVRHRLNEKMNTAA